MRVCGAGAGLQLSTCPRPHIVCVGLTVLKFKHHSLPAAFLNCHRAFRLGGTAAAASRLVTFVTKMETRKSGLGDGNRRETVPPGVHLPTLSRGRASSQGPQLTAARSAVRGTRHVPRLLREMPVKRQRREGRWAGGVTFVRPQPTQCLRSVVLSWSSRHSGPVPGAQAALCVGTTLLVTAQSHSCLSVVSI